jgi:hypothetical protein
MRSRCTLLLVLSRDRSDFARIVEVNSDSIDLRRANKFNHADAILYETDMLRFATGRWVESWRESRDAWASLNRTKTEKAAPSQCQDFLPASSNA